MPPLALGLALLVGVSLGLLGGGGSILTLPILLYVVHMAPKPAIATSLVVVASASFAAVLAHAWSGRVVWKTGLTFGATSMLTSFAAGSVAHHLNGQLLLAGFTVTMLVTGLAMLRKRTESVQRTARSARAAAAGAAVGALTGLVGAGGGFLIVPALVAFGGLDMGSAVGTSLLVITMNSAAGFAGHWGHVPLDGEAAAAMAGAAVLGSLLGSVASRRVSPAQLRGGFALLVLGVGTWIGVREVTALHVVTTMHVSSSLTGIAGGMLIGISASMLLAFNGRIAGVSGIIAGVLKPAAGEVRWRVLFLLGLFVGGLALRSWHRESLGAAHIPLALLALSGALVGIGTRLGSGCTSGHGVCGVSRLSRRSLAATGTFMAAGMLTVFVLKQTYAIGSAP